MSRAEPNLDQLLADMAEDVPPIPADFHEKWTSAVHAEAGHTENSAPVSVSQWPKILSVAAVFVFLIGGTFVYRSARKTNRPESIPVNTMVMTEEEEMETDDGPAALEAAGAADETSFAVMDQATNEPARKMSANETEMDEAVPIMEMAEESNEEAAETDAAEEADEAITQEDAVQGVWNDMAEASVTVPEEHQGLGGFFMDMGDFLLAVWPFLLIAAVPLAVAAGMRKKKKAG